MRTQVKMNAVKTAAAVFALVAALVVSGCKTTANFADYQGKEMGLSIPDWVLIAEGGEGMEVLQNVPRYQDFYCFVAKESGTNRKFTERWAETFNALQQIGMWFQSSIATVMKAQESGLSNVQQEALDRKIDGSVNQLAVGSFSGAKKDATYWTQKKNGEYTAYVLYIMNKEDADKQAIAWINGMADKVPDLLQVSAGATAEIMQNGIAWKEPQVETAKKKK